MKIQKVNLAEKFKLFSDHWSPRIVGELNGQQVKLAKVQGEFVWHKHDQEDELFMVIEGQLTIELEDDKIVLNPGEFAIIPKGTMHRPVAEQEVLLMLLEPSSTLNTGDAGGALTRIDLDRI